MSEQKFNKFVAVFIAVVTMLAAIITYLQSDASARDDQANRDSKRYSLEAFGRQISGDARVNFDYNVAYQAYYEMLLLANSAAEREETAAAERYTVLSDETTQLSPALSEPYYNPEAEFPDFLRYEADTYLVEIVGLQERFLAASAVKDAWDYKANTYIIHITLLAIALFLFGLSTTISGKLTRWVFSGAGTAVTVIAVVWAALLWTKPVFDLRQQGSAIDDYAQGVGLAYQDRYEEAVAAFDKALQAYPGYANAYAERAESHMALGNFEAAADDYLSAIRGGNKATYVAGNLAWTYYLLGRFEEARSMNMQALQSSPDELWIQFDLALNELTAGDIAMAQTYYQQGMDQAAKQVAEAKAAGSEPPSFLWWSLTDAADSLDGLLYIIDTGDGYPALDQVANPDEIYPVAEELVRRLKSLAVALEYTGQPPKSEASAQVTPLEFSEPLYDENDELVGYSEASDVFAAGLKEFSVLFDYAGMEDGKEIVFKLYINGQEDPSWRIVQPWELGSEGEAEVPVSYAYSDTFSFDPGEYMVELYYDWQLIQRGYFTVEE